MSWTDPGVDTCFTRGIRAHSTKAMTASVRNVYDVASNEQLCGQRFRSLSVIRRPVLTRKCALWWLPTHPRAISDGRPKNAELAQDMHEHRGMLRLVNLFSFL